MTETACVLLSNFIFPSDTSKETGLSVVVVLSSLRQRQLVFFSQTLYFLVTPRRRLVSLLL